LANEAVEAELRQTDPTHYHCFGEDMPDARKLRAFAMPEGDTPTVTPLVPVLNRLLASGRGISNVQRAISTSRRYRKPAMISILARASTALMKSPKERRNENRAQTL
jgi:hypothetical protein